MPGTVPQSDHLSTDRLARVFDNTVATYKFYWFEAILDLFITTGKTRFDIWDIQVEMVVNSWHPVCYFHLSFGKSESLFRAIHEIQHRYDLPVLMGREDLRRWLHENRSKVYGTIRFLQLNVPYRFLMPWIRATNDLSLVERSQKFENNCPYRIWTRDGGMRIELNPLWLDYFRDNYPILKNFIYWNLALFVQGRNPNVPNVPGKLVRVEARNSLRKQHEFWDYVMDHEAQKMHCIYTGAELSKGEYDLDHFLPWSFVSHDLLWNLLPADGSINSSKSDRLPDLGEYLPGLASAQQLALRTCLENGHQPKILEDYLSLGCTVQEIADMPKAALYDCFGRVLKPLDQIARNMGFESWIR